MLLVLNPSVSTSGRVASHNLWDSTVKDDARCYWYMMRTGHICLIECLNIYARITLSCTRCLHIHLLEPWIKSGVPHFRIHQNWIDGEFDSCQVCILVREAFNNSFTSVALKSAIRKADNCLPTTTRYFLCLEVKGTDLMHYSLALLSLKLWYTRNDEMHDTEYWEREYWFQKLGWLIQRRVLYWLPINR